MLFTFDAVIGLAGIMALMALMVIAYGTLMRAIARPAWSHAALGALFGGVAILAMFDPIQLVPGVIVDLRNVPVVLAGAFLGLPGAVVATLMALAMRVGIGGTGMVAGSTSIVLVALTGLAWARWVRRPGQWKRNVLLLATLFQVQLVTTFMLPWEVAWRSVTTVWPVVVPIQFTGVVVLAALLKRERHLLAERQRLAEMFARTPSFMAMLRGPEHVIDVANEAFMRVAGQRDMLGRTVREVLPCLEGQGFFELLDRVYASGEAYVGRATRVLQLSPEGKLKERFVDFVYQPVRDADGVVAGMFVEGSDVTLQVMHERMLDQSKLAAEDVARTATAMAMTDSLTGLPNRRSTLRELGKAMAAAQRTGQGLSVALLDVDHFKRVNDTFGHAAGDEVLRRVARDAEVALGGEGVVGRVGGEEFLLVLPGADRAAAMAAAERVRVTIRAGGGVPGMGPSVSASFGVATWSGEDTVDLLLQRADRALYKAKRSGRNRSCFAVEEPGAILEGQPSVTEEGGVSLLNASHADV